MLLTFFSPSGYEVRKNYEGADIICYLPLDTPLNAIRFLRLVRPVMAFFIKYEFWYNYLHILKHRCIPTYSVSSIFRPDQVFFRFVRVLQIKDQSKHLPLVEAFKNDCPVFVAGSSWQPDEDIFIRYFNEHKDWKLIIAPHVISEDHLQQILSKLNLKTVRYTQTTPEAVADAKCLIIDCFGLLSSIYHYGEVAYVGGGFGVGIHNVLEAAVWNVPVLFGPNNKRFQEAQELLASGGGIEISDYDTFASQMQRFISDRQLLKECGSKAGEYVKGKAGATEIVLKNSPL